MESQCQRLSARIRCCPSPVLVLLLFSLLSSLCSLCLCGESNPTKEPHRSPIDLVVLPGGRQLLAANHTADTVSLVDLKAGKILAEQPCGRKPVAVATSPDGKRAAVSNLWSGTITLLEVHDAALKPIGEVAVGAFPRGLVFAGDGQTFFAAVAGADEVVQIDWSGRKILHRWPAPREPRHLALAADGQWLAAASSRSAQVRVWHVPTRKLHWERTIVAGFNLRGLAFASDGQSVVCAHVVRREFPVSRENIEEGWVIDSRLTRFPLRSDAVPVLQQLALDTKGKAVGDPHGLAFSGDGKRLVLTGSGTQELLMLDAAAVPWSSGDPGDFLHPKLADGEHKMRRVPLGGRPLALAFLEGDGQVVVANYLADAVQVVDGKDGKLLRTIALGGPAKPSPARQGEALFYDARRSHNQWFSCHTCHVEGHTCGLNFDTLNDDSYGNPKLTPTLRNVTRTGPWTWHGWQKDLGAAVTKSYTETMFGPRPSADEVKAVLAYLETLDHPPNPHVGRDGSLGESARRGQALFQGKAKCARCHKGEQYTSESNYDVKLEPDGSPYKLWNPPSLRGVWDRGPYLHDGRARTLDDLLHKHHTPEMLGGEALTLEERQDLIEFLRSL
jgi:DNA-binding beta-propeller fold protein YncE